MNNNLLALVAVLGVILVIGGIVAFVPKLKKNNTNLQPYFDGTKDLLKTGKAALNVADEIIPGNPGILVLKTIEKWAEIAVGNSEQLYHTKEVEKDARKEVAQNVAYSMLKELGLDVTDNRKALIDAAINNAVDGLGHKSPSDAEKEAAHQELQVQLQKQTEENIRLNQVISQIKGTVNVQQ